MPAPLPFSARLAAELLRRHAKGATVAELLAFLRAGHWKGSASPSGLHSWILRNGGARRYKLPKPPPEPKPKGPRKNAKPARNAAVVAALAAGMRPGEAARLFGINRKRVWAIANRAKRLAEAEAKGYSVASACEPPDQGASPPPPSADGCNGAGSAPSSLPT